MTEFWRQQRIERATNVERRGPTVSSNETRPDANSDGGYLHVHGQFLTTKEAATVLGFYDPDHPDHSLVAEHLNDDDHTGVTSVLYQRGFRAWDFFGDNDELPQLVADLQGRARRAIRFGRYTQDPDHPISEGQCRVALHYVMSGEGTWVPRGGPFGVPTAAPAPDPVEWGSGSPVVAVVDTGLDPGSATAKQDAQGHSVMILDPTQDLDALKDTLVSGAPSTDLAAEAGHGTFITSLVERMAGGGVPVVNVRCLEPNGFGTEAQVLAALHRLVTACPDIAVVNMSFGGYTDPVDYAATLGSDFDDANPPNSMPMALGSYLDAFIDTQQTTAWVAAAGNSGVAGRPFWPAALPQVVAVASLKPDLTASSFTNFGDWVDLCTVGEDIVGDYPTGTYPMGAGQSEQLSGGARWTGTSFAAAVVAAEIARRFAHQPAGQPPSSAAKVAADLLSELAPNQGPSGCGVVWDPVHHGVQVDPRAPLPPSP